MDAKQWLKIFLIASLFLILLVSTINYFVNPYNIFGHGYDKYFSNKTEILSDEMTKFYVANRINPKTIMIGTSRIGFFSESQLDPYLDAPIYNLALPGSTINEQATYIKYMIKHHPIKNIIWSLDFFSFNPDKPENPSFDSNRLSNKIYWNDYPISLFNFKTLDRSLKTIKNNYLFLPKKINSQPFNRTEIEANINYTLKEYAGQKAFLKSEVFKKPSSIDQKILLLKNTIELCHENNVTCILYTSPVYYKHIDMYYSIGLGNTFEYWKKSLASIQPYTDFCAYNTLNHNIMNFRDSTHAISNVGNLIFARIFNPKIGNLPHDFGYTVTPDNVDQYLNKERKSHDAS